MVVALSRGESLMTSRRFFGDVQHSMRIGGLRNIDHRSDPRLPCLWPLSPRKMDISCKPLSKGPCRVYTMSRPAARAPLPLRGGKPIRRPLGPSGSSTPGSLAPGVSGRAGTSAKSAEEGFLYVAGVKDNSKRVSEFRVSPHSIPNVLPCSVFPRSSRHCFVSVKQMGYRRRSLEVWSGVQYR